MKAGVKALDGYQTEFVLDEEQYVIRIPAGLESMGALVELLSIVEKAIDEALRLPMVRCPDAAAAPDWLYGRPCLVA